MNNISKFKEELRKKGIKGLALDIDETLSFTVDYWVKELSRKFGNPEGLSAIEIFKKYRRVQNYPHWKSKEALEWIEWARGADEIQIDMPLIENSNHIVNEINKVVPIVCYLTLRPEKILSGTSAWLERHGFPKGEIIATPKLFDHEKGGKWKAEILAKLYPELLGIVDDNPKLIEFLPKNYKGVVFLYDFDSYTSNRKNIIPCRTWEDVLLKVKKKFT